MHRIAESPGPLSKHFPRQIKVDLETDVDLETIVDEEEDSESDGDDVGIEAIDEIVLPDNADVEEDEEVKEVEEVEEVEEVVEKEDEEVEEDEEVVAKEDEEDDKEVEEDDKEVEEAKEDVVFEVSHDLSPEEDISIRYYEDVSPVVEHFSLMRKENGMYIVPFSKPLVIQTPVVVLNEPLTNTASLKVSAKFAKFIDGVEQSILAATKVNKSLWFKKDLDNATIEGGFKSFLDGNILKVKVDKDLASFDEEERLIGNDFETPIGVRCILEASEINFGQLEFGVIFSLVQVQLVKPPKCKITKFKKPVTTYFE
ncbi:hypothetical protein PBCVAP110A_426L [Paramecium bursaria Chlorella virus AP110A]|nr:hypothetical protein PBCVAP110A_426L [Paramecium bursaria Chlorella virus AP110A]